MISLNKKNLCERCFHEVGRDGVCRFCGTQKNKDKYPTALTEGTILIGKYVVGKVLGKGGFGVTYLCYDSKENKSVAIKEYLPDSLTHRNTGDTMVSTYGGESEGYFKVGAQKFYDEAKLVSRFNGNPNIISVYEFFYENNTTYYVMEYLDGMDLKHYIYENNGRISIEEAVYICKKITEALLIVHTLDVLHRDISPDNIYICSDQSIKLIDFGAARQVLGEASKSLSVILKQGFAPLEQYQRKGKQGPWTDIYALGATIYYALTGTIIDDAMTRIMDDTVDYSGIPSEFAAVLKKMLEVRIEDRFQNTFELKNALDSMKIEGKPIVLKKAEPHSLQFETSDSREVRNGVYTANKKNRTAFNNMDKNNNISAIINSAVNKKSYPRENHALALELPSGKNSKIILAGIVLLLVILIAVTGIIEASKKNDNTDALATTEITTTTEETTTTTTTTTKTTKKATTTRKKPTTTKKKATTTKKKLTTKRRKSTTTRKKPTSTRRVTTTRRPITTYRGPTTTEDFYEGWE
ncbi:MAG: protein kinase domain-containing protein [Eubacterium sp.]